MPTITLVREVDCYRRTMTIDTIDWDGAPRGWKVRVSAYDGKSPMPSLFELIARRLKAFPETRSTACWRRRSRSPRPCAPSICARGDDQLTVIPPTLNKLTALEVLRLDGNGLPEIPEEIEKLKELRELHAANNALVTMPAVHTLKRLAVLDLRNNRLATSISSRRVPCDSSSAAIRSSWRCKTCSRARRSVVFGP